MKPHMRMMTSKEDEIEFCKTMIGIKRVDKDLCVILSDSARNSGHQMKGAVPRFRTDRNKVLNLCDSLTKLFFGMPNAYTEL